MDSGGDVFSFGNARFAGSVGGKSESKPLRKPVVAIVPTRRKPITSISATPAGDGYWLAAAGDGVLAFGGSAFLGNALTSLSCATPAPTASGSVIVQYATNIMKGQPEHLHRNRRDQQGIRSGRLLAIRPLAMEAARRIPPGKE